MQNMVLCDHDRDVFLLKDLVFAAPKLCCTSDMLSVFRC